MSDQLPPWLQETEAYMNGKIMEVNYKASTQGASVFDGTWAFNMRKLLVAYKELREAAWDVVGRELEPGDEPPGCHCAICRLHQLLEREEPPEVLP